MAIPTTQIFLRSPYLVTKERANLDYIIVSLYIWTGDLVTDKPTSETIILRRTAFDGKATVDISEFARDYVEVTFGGTESSQAVWIEYQIQWVDTDTTTGTDSAVQLTGLDGFSYFEDDVNYQWANDILLGSDYQRGLANTTIYTPVLQDYLTGYEHWKNPSVGAYNTVTGLTTNDDTSDVIQYVSNFVAGEYADYIIFNFNNGGAYQRQIDFNYDDCSEYNMYQVYFVNRYGAIQQVQFFGRSDVTMEVSSESFKRSILANDGTYSKTRHQSYVRNKNGKIQFSLNTGWYIEEENDIFTELMLSEQVWIKFNKSELGLGWVGKESSTVVLPVLLKTQSQRLKRKKTDQLINYTFQFEGASDRINTVR